VPARLGSTTIARRPRGGDATGTHPDLGFRDAQRKQGSEGEGGKVALLGGLPTSREVPAVIVVRGEGEGRRTTMKD
jgi:hypothetical protein